MSIHRAGISPRQASHFFLLAQKKVTKKEGLEHQPLGDHAAATRLTAEALARERSPDYRFGFLANANPLVIVSPRPCGSSLVPSKTTTGIDQEKMDNMRYRTSLLVSVAVLLSACTSNREEVEVTISPSQYKVGNVESKLATPVVDEVVKLKPRAVHIHTCTATPPERLLQFNIELDARLEAKKTMSFTAQGC